jgi:predicted small lipoprotein YifL
MTRKLTATLLAAILGLGIAACEREGPMEEAGEEADEAVEDAGEAAEDAGESMEDTAEEAEEKLENE